MTKISVTGPKTQLQPVIETLYDLNVMDLDDYQGELEKGDSFEEADELSEVLVDVRSLISKMPEVDSEARVSLSEIQDNIDDIKARVEKLESERNRLERRKSELRDHRGFFKKLESTGLSYEDLEGTEKLSVYVGAFDTTEFENAVETGKYDIFTGEGANVIIFYDEAEEEVENALRSIDSREMSVPDVDLEGSIENVSEKLKQEVRSIELKLEGVEEDFDQLSKKWYPKLVAAENFMTEKVEKAEAPIKFATTDSTFIAYGWVPSEMYARVEERLAQATQGKIHVQKEEGENPPVQHDNNKIVEPFESLTDLVSIPKYNELDPSFMIFLTFPLVFGFMIGDAGYGLTSLAVFYAGYKKIPAAREVFKSLMWASVATIFFGLIFGDAFGYIIFGHDSVLTALTGIELFQQIPVLFHRAHRLGDVFAIAAAFGVLHVNLGYLLGFYNEYVKHGFKEAFLEKASWIFIEIGAAAWYFYGASVGGPIIALSIIMLYLGEGIEGIVEIPSLLSNILSYLRIFGVAVAAVSLAAVVNGIAQTAFSAGGILGIVAGVTMLLVGHTFNTFIKIMEGFLQGIRLHYVELFTKFYEGGGRKYIPFGTKNNI